MTGLAPVPRFRPRESGVKFKNKKRREEQTHGLTVEMGVYMRARPNVQ